MSRSERGRDGCVQARSPSQVARDLIDGIDDAPLPSHETQ
jgi:hypothetical protein